MGSRQTKITLDFLKIAKKKSLNSLTTKSIFFKAETNAPIVIDYYYFMNLNFYNIPSNP